MKMLRRVTSLRPFGQSMRPTSTYGVDFPLNGDDSIAIDGS